MSKLHRMISIYCRNGYFICRNNIFEENSLDQLIGYGPLGYELRRNFINEWWYSTVCTCDNINPIHCTDFITSYNTVDNSCNKLNDVVSKLKEYANTQKYTLPFGITLECNKDYGSDHSSSLMEFRQLFFFCSSKHVDEWLVYWKRRRLRWWKEFSRSPEKFILDEGRERNAIKYVYPDGKQILEDINVIQSDIGEVPSSVIMSSLRIDTGIQAVMCDSYSEQTGLSDEMKRPLLKLDFRLSPVKVAVSPKQHGSQYLFSSKLTEELCHAGILTKCYYEDSLESFHDLIGTPFRVLIDEDTLTNGILYLQDRNSGLSEPMESQALLYTLLRMFQRFKNH